MTTYSFKGAPSYNAITSVENFRSAAERGKTFHHIVEAAAASRTPPWVLSGWGCRGRVFQQPEEILIGRLGLGGFALHGIGSADLEMRESADGVVEHNSAMVDDF